VPFIAPALQEFLDIVIYTCCFPLAWDIHYLYYKQCPMTLTLHVTFVELKEVSIWP
jgi:hypothetical protein